MTEGEKARDGQIRTAARKLISLKKRPRNIMAMAFALQDRFDGLGYEKACDYIFKSGGLR